MSVRETGGFKWAELGPGSLLYTETIDRGYHERWLRVVIDNSDPDRNPIIWPYGEDLNESYEAGDEVFYFLLHKEPP